MRQPHAHGDLEWNYAIDCEIIYQHSGKEVTLQPGKIALFWAGLSHQVTQVCRPGHIIIGVLPLQRFLAWRLPPAALKSLLEGAYLWGPSDSHGDDGRLLAQWCADLAQHSPDSQRLVELEAQARFTRILQSTADTNSKTHSGLYQFIEALVHPELRQESIATCAQHAGLTPQYASSIFKQSTGLNPGAFRNAWRIDQALAQLLAGTVSIEAISKLVGFQSLSSFYAAFERHLGSSPARWRAQQQARHDQAVQAP